MVKVLGFRVQGISFRVYILETRVSSYGFRVRGLRFKRECSRFRGQEFWLQVEGCGLLV